MPEIAVETGKTGQPDPGLAADRPVNGITAIPERFQKI
jgi:hypothetical protein